MAGTNIDMGNMKSRDIGNLVSKGLVEYGKQVLQEANPTSEIDYGDLPSRALPELGKQVIQGKINE
jgi:hypothetical protein